MSIAITLLEPLLGIVASGNAKPCSFLLGVAGNATASTGISSAGVLSIFNRCGMIAQPCR